MFKQVEMMVMIGYIHYNSVLFYLLCISYYPVKCEYLKQFPIIIVFVDTYTYILYRWVQYLLVWRMIFTQRHQVLQHGDDEFESASKARKYCQ